MEKEEEPESLPILTHGKMLFFSVMPHRRAWELHYCKRYNPFRTKVYDECRTELCAHRGNCLQWCLRVNVFINTHGRDITVQSDHKPLEAITNKPLACVPPRLQRMLLRLQRYNVKVVYVPGKQIPLADTPSRIFLKTKSKLPRDDLEDSARVHET